MVSGIPTASGYEERIRFSELEVVDAGAIDRGVMHSLPEGNLVNGWDVNVSGVRMISVKRNVRYHKHAVSYLFLGESKTSTAVAQRSVTLHLTFTDCIRSS